MSGGLIRDAIQQAEGFQEISSRSLDLLTSAAAEAVLNAGDALFEADEPADDVFIVIEGRIGVFARVADGRLVPALELGPGQVVGEIRNLTGGKRTIAARATSPARLIRLPKTAFDEVTTSELDFAERIRIIFLHRLRRQHLAVVLGAQFGDLTYAEMAEIEALGEWYSLEKGNVLCRQGEPGDSAFLLVSGLLGVLVEDKLVNRIPYGELVGEMAVLSDEKRSATIYAIRQAELLRFAKPEFLALIERYPRFLLQIARLNMNRLRDTMAASGPDRFTSIAALVPAAADVPLSNFARRLSQALAARCAILHISPQSLAAMLGASNAPTQARQELVHARFPAWLSSQEGQYQLILLETDWSDPQWTKLCIEQCDQVLTIGRGGGDPALSEAERLHVYRQQDAGEIARRLVLIHPEDCVRPQGTGAWLRSRSLQMHHHVRLGREDDFHRLARFLTGSAVCLALGGGGARGFAHIGALRALREEGVPIDIVGGTSMGAVIGAQYAFGMTADQMLATCRGMFSNAGLVFDMTLPLLSFTTGKAFGGKLQLAFGDMEIEDLWIPYFCVSSNISRAQMAIHTTGPLWWKVRASAGVQGLFPPVVLDGDLHVDGAPFSNLPADAMKSVCLGKVIAIDVSPPLDLLNNTDYGYAISGWRILWKRWFPGRQPFQCADLGTIMQRAGEAVSMANQKRAISGMADYYFQMPVEKIGLLDFGKLSQLEQIGYDFSRKQIAVWRAAGAWIRP